MGTEETTILILDEDNPHRHSLSESFRKVGFSVVTCSDAERALSILRLGEVNMLITDLMRSRTNRMDLIPQARSLLPGLRIVVTSDSPSSFLRSQSLRKGANLFLEKPVDIGNIVEFFSSSQNADSFSGCIDGIDIIDYLQFIMLTGKQVILEVTSEGSERGVVFLNGGRVLHAICGDVEGEEALYRCLAYKGGNFAHLPWHDPANVTIDKPGEFLLMEASRRRDEQMTGDPSDLDQQVGSPGGG